MCCHSGVEPWRTTIALVYAANDMMTAPMPTHTPVRATFGGAMLSRIASDRGGAGVGAVTEGGSVCMT